MKINSKKIGMFGLGIIDIGVIVFSLRKFFKIFKGETVTATVFYKLLVNQDKDMLIHDFLNYDKYKIVTIIESSKKDITKYYPLAIEPLPGEDEEIWKAAKSLYYKNKDFFNHINNYYNQAKPSIYHRQHITRYKNGKVIWREGSGL